MVELCECATCIAVGEAITYAPVSPNHIAVYSIGTETSGLWSWTTTVGIPVSGVDDESFASVSCPSATTCVAVGTDLGGFG